jgi:hypothetical protein
MRCHCPCIKGVALASLALPLRLGRFAPQAEAAKLGIYFDANGTKEGLDVAPFSVFTFYAVASDLSSGVVGYEFELDYSDGITILSSAIHPAGALNVGSNNVFRVGTGGACHGGGGAFVLVTFTAMLTRDGSNLALRATGPRSLPSIDDETPAYVPCGDASAYGFDETPAGFVNPKTDSFGRVKERYDS